MGLELPASGYVQDGSGYVAGFFGEEPEDGGGYFFGVSAALHGDGDFDALDAVGFASKGVEFGVDEAGADGVDSYLLFGNFFGQAEGESFDGSFGRGIVDVFVGRAHARGSGRNVDDVAALATMFGGHAADGFASAEKTSKNIGGEDAVEARSVDLIETRLAIDGAGVIYQRGDGAELVGGGVEEADYVVFFADVGLNSDGDGGALFLADGADDFFGGFAVAKVVNADAVSAGGGEMGGGGSDAAAGAGDDEDLGSGHVGGF